MVILPVHMIDEIKSLPEAKVSLTIPALREEIEFAFSQTLGEYDYEDWAPVAIYPKINRIVAMVSGRIFLGKQMWQEGGVGIFNNRVGECRLRVVDYNGKISNLASSLGYSVLVGNKESSRTKGESERISFSYIFRTTSNQSQ
jgi:hypothetical protein